MAIRVRSDVTRAKDDARNRRWRADHHEQIHQRQIASRERAKAAQQVEVRTPMNAGWPVDVQEANWIELEQRIRAVVAAAIAKGTIERGSKWFGYSVEALRATPLPVYAPPSRKRRRS